MKQWINRFLNKKTDFTEDKELSTLNDQFFYLLGEERRLLNVLLKRNIKYFFTHKKLYLLKLFIVACIYVGLGVGIISGSLLTLDYFNVVDIRRPEVIKEYKTAYSPDWDTINQRKLKEDGYEVIIFFDYDSKKDWKSFKAALSKVESGGKYNAKSGQYWGKYQLGDNARKAAGVSSATWEQFSTNPDMQEGAFLSWMRIQKNISLKYNLYKYLGKYVNGYQVTESGLLALVHNVGVGGAMTYLKTNGDSIPPGNPKAFIRLGGYNLNLD